MDRDRRGKAGLWIFGLPLIVTAISLVPVYWYVEQAVAAERVLEPDRVYVESPQWTQPEASPPLPNGENMRSQTRYTGKTKEISVTAEDLLSGFLLLVSNANPLPEDYDPGQLAEIRGLGDAPGQAAFSITKTVLELEPFVGTRLWDMIACAWEEDGLGGFLLQSGYRGVDYQAMLYRRKVQEYKNMGYKTESAEEAAAFWVARPRESEHNTGLAFDITSRSHPDLHLSFANTSHGKWLAHNAWRFGFIVRYPEEKTGITRIGFEPWHLRYIGRPHSDMLTEKDWCLEEYLDFLANEGGFTIRDENGAVWQVDYQIPAEGRISVPADKAYTLSGDGDRGYIVTTLLDEGAPDNS